MDVVGFGKCMLLDATEGCYAETVTLKYSAENIEAESTIVSHGTIRVKAGKLLTGQSCKLKQYQIPNRTSVDPSFPTKLKQKN